MKKFAGALNRLHRGQQGWSGASVLAYGVLSAGIFSSEKAKVTVYKGLEKARGTLELSRSVIGLNPNQTRLESVASFIGLTVPNQKVVINSININYWDTDTHYEGCTKTIELSANSPERGYAV